MALTYTVITPYCDDTYATAYWADRIAPAAWTAASSGDKTKAIKMATAYINMLDFVGYKTSDTQANEFPRNDETTIPVEVANATCEIAATLLTGGTTLAQQQSAGNIRSESVGDASRSYATSVQEQSLGVISPEAARLLAPWLRDPSEIRMERET